MSDRGTTGRLMRLPPAQRWPIVIGMALLSLSAFFPLYVMASNAFRSNLDWANSQIGLPTTTSLGAFRRAWEGASIGSSFVNSIEISFGTVLLSLAVATMAAYACSKIAWRPRQVVFLFLLFWIVVPPLVLLVPVYIELADIPLLHNNLLDSKFGIVLVYTAVNLPFNVYLMTAYFRSLPDELLEAARIDGATIPQTFLMVMVPLARPALATLAIFNFLWAWNEFMFALFILHLDQHQAADGRRAAAAGALRPGPHCADGGPLHRDPAGDRRVPDLPAPPGAGDHRRRRQVARLAVVAKPLQ